MPIVVFDRKKYSLDEHGYLDPPEQWDEAFAEGMARRLGITPGLSEDHWRIIRYLRKSFLEEGTVPVMVQACLQNGLRLSRFRSLFPAGYHRCACRIAGINYRFIRDANYWLTYETGPPLKARYRLDPMGFLEVFEDWDRDFADLVLSESLEIREAGEEHWRFIEYLRRFYTEHRRIPTVYEACTANALSLERLQALFPSGYRRGACRAAGLPFFS